MSNATTAALALALGAGAGFAIYHFTRDGKKPPDRAAPSPDATTPPAGPGTPAAPSTTTAAPPRKPGPCSLKLDRGGLTLEGEIVDIPTAVARCKVAGRAELAVAPDASVTVNRELYSALITAGVATVIKTP